MKRYQSAFLILLILLLIFPSIAYPGERVRTGILGAMDAEIQLLQDQLAYREELRIEGLRFMTGQINGRTVVIAQTGIGKVNAAMTAILLIEHFKPKEVIFTGIADGLNPELMPGDIVLGEKTAQHDFGSITQEGFESWGVRNPITNERNPVFFPGDSMLIALAQLSATTIQFDQLETSKGNRIPRVIQGTIVTGDVFISSSAKKAQLRQRFEADAVEMEGAVVAQICWQCGIPCLIIRSLSDSADENADQDFRRFYEIAARNSARLVIELIGQLRTVKAFQRESKASRRF
ncbi:5'-methylthioadenosine/adenosylhomocysteine nucleosidase [candidate division KSB1 bacterium]|nr:5'-methylthioadenosine/adenosylhomocysteine nucleosidase [candidate division KSB1 bacterium]